MMRLSLGPGNAHGTTSSAPSVVSPAPTATTFPASNADPTVTDPDATETTATESAKPGSTKPSSPSLTKDCAGKKRRSRHTRHSKNRMH
ncbi:hypothetical protein DL765_006641 [Monosporascus sp. GIB2]|nr:hypothetical protein DL765_006641 [Monosporascus sp. GIB2]